MLVIEISSIVSMKPITSNFKINTRVKKFKKIFFFKKIN